MTKIEKKTFNNKHGKGRPKCDNTKKELIRVVIWDNCFEN